MRDGYSAKPSKNPVDHQQNPPCGGSSIQQPMLVESTVCRKCGFICYFEPCGQCEHNRRQRAKTDAAKRLEDLRRYINSAEEMCRYIHTDKRFDWKKQLGKIQEEVIREMEE